MQTGVRLVMFEDVAPFCAQVWLSCVSFELAFPIREKVSSSLAWSAIKASLAWLVTRVFSSIWVLVLVRLVAPATFLLIKFAAVFFPKLGVSGSSMNSSGSRLPQWWTSTDARAFLILHVRWSKSNQLWPLSSRPQGTFWCEEVAVCVLRSVQVSQL